MVCACARILCGVCQYCVFVHMYLTYKTKAGVRDTIKGKLKFPAHPHQHPQKKTQNRAQGQKGGCMRIKKTKKNQL